MKKRAFTLIELLVVIAIIAILAAILFPVFAQARDKARQATCISNIKQLALGMTMYIQDYDETLLFRAESTNCYYHYICDDPNRPRDFRYPLDWWDVVFPYTKNNKVYFCPSSPPTTSTLLTPFGITGVSIGYNRGHGNSLVENAIVGTVTPGVKLAAVTRPADTIMLGEAGHNWNPAATAAAFDSSNNQSPVLRGSPSRESGSEWGPEPRHSGGANMGFVDGHAKWMRPQQFYGVIDVPNKRIVVDCNGIWFRANRDEKVAGDPPAPACGQ
jgi:prepilin-type N-terminal cleavage/methylation domain-containing protein/prepilin-type processing-associated H-X9-DG protein